MKIKRFDNLWTMGLIISCVLLLVVYIVKLFCPESVIQIAECEQITKIGNIIDNNTVLYYLFNFVVCMFVYFFYCCACCRVKTLTIYQMLILALVNILLFVVQKYLSSCYVFINTISLIVCPAIICFMNKKTDIKYLYSTAITFTIHLMAQLISLEIRNISQMITQYNSATIIILLIDAYIWLVLLYKFFSYKE